MGGAEPAAARRSRVPAWVVWCALIALAFVVYLVRAKPLGQAFTFGSEDVSVFVNQPRALGLGRSFTVAYAGYYHLLPRLGGALSFVVPVAAAPYVTYLFSGVVAVAIAALTYRCGRGLRLSWPASLLLSAYVLILPAAGYEVVGNLPNLEWYCLAGVVVFVAAWLGGYRPPLVPTVILLGVAGLTSPVIAVVLLFVVPVAAIRRSRYDLAVAGILALTAGIQYLARFTDSLPVSALEPRPAFTAQLYSVRVGLGSLVGDRPLMRLHGLVGDAPVLEVLGLVVIVAVVALCVRLDGTDRLVAAFLVVTSAAIVALAVTSRPEYFETIGLGFLGAGVLFNGRYMGVPALCLTMVVILGVDRWRAGRTDVASRTAVAVAAGLAVVVLAANTRLDLHRPGRDDYSRQVSEAEAACEESGPDGVITIRTGPFSTPDAGFALMLTCRQAF